LTHVPTLKRAGARKKNDEETPMSVRKTAGQRPPDALLRAARLSAIVRRGSMFIACAAAGLLVACAAAVPAQPVRFDGVVPAQVPAEFVLRTSATVKLSTGYSRELPAGGRWRAVGSLPQGTVYSPVGTVFSIEGRHVHEAYLVVRGSVLNGFYLPAESNFSPLEIPLQLTLGAPS
jgi:hypothetical protein